jgi:hypothetical protein
MDSKLILEGLLALKNNSYKKDMNKPLEVSSLSGARVKKINNRSMSYADRHRGNWFKPEYDLTEIQIAQDVDSYVFKAIQKKVHRFVLAGWEIVGNDKETVSYVRKRLREIELVSGMPFDIIMKDLAHDLIRYSNCAWVKVRNKDASTGKVRSVNGKDIEPVAGYFLLPFETLWFKVKKNGEIKKIMQEVPNTGETKEFAPQDVIHFYTNKKPGFTMGTPELLPVLEDISLLRRLEENVENMIDANLHPLFHYKVGNDNLPERFGPDGIKETDLVRNTIEYMPSGGIFVSDHRHKIEAIGSEGKALSIQDYIDYFKKRVFAGLGVSPIDMGEGDTANRSTANTLSKIAIQDVEALQRTVKTFVETYIINEILLEGGYESALLDDNLKVEIKFGNVDKEEKSKEENQAIQLWTNNLINETEARKRLGERPVEVRDLSYYKLYQEPLALVKAMGAFSAASDALGKHESSNISESGIKKEEGNSVEKQTQAGRPNNSKLASAENLSKSISRPKNQHGERLAPKFNSDAKNIVKKIVKEENLLNIIDIIENS